MARSKIHLKFPDWKERLARAMPEIRLLEAATIQANRGMLFDAEGARNGHERWAPLKFRNGQILTQRGNLRKSIAPNNKRGTPGPDGIVRFQGDEIIVGTNLAYAAMMNWGTTKLPGGVLRPTNAKALKIPLPSGKSANPTAKELRKGASGAGKDKFIFVKSVKIPARRFDEWTDADKAEMETVLANKIAEVLTR